MFILTIAFLDREEDGVSFIAIEDQLARLIECPYSFNTKPLPGMNIICITRFHYIFIIYLKKTSIKTSPYSLVERVSPHCGKCRLWVQLSLRPVLNTYVSINVIIMLFYII